MKIILLNGSGESQKRAALVNFKKKFTEVSVIDLKISSIPSLNDELSQNGLFNDNTKLVVAENTPDNLNLEGITGSANTTLLLIAGNPRESSKLLQSAKKVQAETRFFTAEKEVLIFNYLDLLMDKNEAVFAELNNLLNHYDATYIISMIYYLLRRNILPLPVSSYQKQKITRQKLRFDNENWISMYRLTIETEFKIKSGLTDGRNGISLLTERLLQI